MKTFKEFISEGITYYGDASRKRDESLKSRGMDNDFIGHELAKHDISAEFQKTPTLSFDKKKYHTKIWVHPEDHAKAKEVVKQLGYHDTHHVLPKTKYNPEKDYEGTPVAQGSSIKYTGD